MSEEMLDTQHVANSEIDNQDDWHGGKEPMKASYGKLMMWYFLLSDAFTFSAFIIAYLSIRFSAAWWPDPNKVFNGFPGFHFEPGQTGLPLGFVSLMTFILILSSVFVVLAVVEGHRNNKKGVATWLSLGILGGIAFLGCQAWEWTHLIHDGMTPFFNPYGPDADGITKLNSGTPGPPAFGGAFFGITGFHGFHVFTGICLNIYGLIGTLNGTFEKRNNNYEMVEKLGLYWHFVDLVWVFVFLAFYLI